MFRALNTVIITPWTLCAGMCKHTPSEDGQHTDQHHTTQYEQCELDYQWVTLGYDTSQNYNIAVLTQHWPAAHPVLALLSKAQTRPLYHHHLIPAGERKSWQETCVCLSACQQCPRQQGVRIHTGTTILSSCGTRGAEETGKASKNWRGDCHLGLPTSRGISDEKVSHLPLPQPSQNTVQCCCTKTASV